MLPSTASDGGNAALSLLLDEAVADSNTGSGGGGGGVGIDATTWMRVAEPASILSGTSITTANTSTLIFCRRAADEPTPKNKAARRMVPMTPNNGIFSSTI